MCSYNSGVMCDGVCGSRFGPLCVFLSVPVKQHGTERRVHVLENPLSGRKPNVETLLSWTYSNTDIIDANNYQIINSKITLTDFTESKDSSMKHDFCSPVHPSPVV